ncbi:hypothetical protein PVAP13_7KG280600, partial [Panicum virgatum]
GVVGRVRVPVPRRRLVGGAVAGGRRDLGAGVHPGAAHRPQRAGLGCRERRRRVRAFDGGTELDMSLRAFLERFSRYAHVSAQVYVVAYAYLDRLRRRDAGVRVVRANAQRLLTAAILVASKFVEDRNYSNSHLAAVGGLTAAELSALELDLLFLMEFRLNVCPSVFQSYCRHLEREASHGGGYRVERRLEKALVCAGEARARQAQHRRAAAA